MDGFEKLKDSLLDSARGEADAILASATAHIAEIGKENADRVWLMKEEASKKLDALDEQDRQRTKAMSVLKSRRDELIIRHQLIEEVLGEAFREIAELDESEKRTYYEKLIPVNLDGVEKLLCSEADMDLLRSVAEDRGLEGIRVEADPNVSGGIVFCGEKFRIDLSLESVFREKNEELTRRVNDILFADESSGEK